MSKKPQKTCTILDAERIRADIQSPDPVVRAAAARLLCPCQHDRLLFENFQAELKVLSKDPDPKVRAIAIHVFEDAYLHQNDGFLVAMGKHDTEMAIAEYRRPQHGRKPHRPQKLWRANPAGGNQNAER